MNMHDVHVAMAYQYLHAGQRWSWRRRPEWLIWSKCRWERTAPWWRCDSCWPSGGSPAGRLAQELYEMETIITLKTRYIRQKPPNLHDYIPSFSMLQYSPYTVLKSWEWTWGQGYNLYTEEPEDVQLTSGEVIVGHVNVCEVNQLVQVRRVCEVTLWERQRKLIEAHNDTMYYVTI